MKKLVFAIALMALTACGAKQPARGGNADVTTVVTDNAVVKDVPVREPAPKVQP